MSMCVKCGTAFIGVTESKLPEDALCLWCERDKFASIAHREIRLRAELATVNGELLAALKLAINTVECASIDPVTKSELPWYKAAKRAINLADPIP